MLSVYTPDAIDTVSPGMAILAAWEMLTNGKRLIERPDILVRRLWMALVDVVRRG